MVLLLVAGCSSSSAAGSDPESSAMNGLSQDELDPNQTDIIVEPVPVIDADPTDPYVPSAEDFTDEGNSTQNNASQQETSVSENIDPSAFDVNMLKFEEFDNFYGDITYNGVPEARESKPLKDANGIWRYNLKMKYTDPSQGYMYDELGYVQMYVNGSDDPPIRITLHPRKASDGYESWDESDESISYKPFAGNIDDDNIIRLKGNDAILVPEYYYAYQGKEYMIAKLWMSEESYADFLMIRGQE